MPCKCFWVIYWGPSHRGDSCRGLSAAFLVLVDQLVHQHKLEVQGLSVVSPPLPSSSHWETCFMRCMWWCLSRNIEDMTGFSMARRHQVRSTDQSHPSRKNKKGVASCSFQWRLVEHPWTWTPWFLWHGNFLRLGPFHLELLHHLNACSALNGPTKLAEGKCYGQTKQQELRYFTWHCRSQHWIHHGSFAETGIRHEKKPALAVKYGILIPYISLYGLWHNPHITG